MDDDLLALCNRAFEMAAAERCARVEIAHVILSLPGWRRGDEALAREGLTAAGLGRNAERWLRSADRQRERTAPQTSGDLKEILRRAERCARVRGRSFAIPSDFIHALVSDAADLASAAFMAELRLDERRSLAREDWRESGEEFEGGRGNRSPAWADDRGRARSPDRFAPPEPVGPPHAGDRYAQPDPSMLSRLERQEKQIADLLALVSRMLSREETERTSGGGQRTRTRVRRSGGIARWRKTRTVTIGEVRDRVARPAGAEVGSVRPDRMLQVVVRNEPAIAGPRLRTLRDAPGSGFDDNGAFASDDDGDEEAEQGDRMKRFYLSPDDDVVKAPSIGPKTAARLKPVGLVLVRDLLACDPHDIAARTSNRYITAARVTEWKAQARLVCTIPWLRGTHAQLLVGAGYDTLAKLARADASAVYAAILRFVATREGQSILRSSPAPEIDRIACWIENTALAEPARAA